jgi:hypothetical protein
VFVYFPICESDEFVIIHFCMCVSYSQMPKYFMFVDTYIENFATYIQAAPILNLNHTCLSTYIYFNTSKNCGLIRLLSIVLRVCDIVIATLLHSSIFNLLFLSGSLATAIYEYKHLTFPTRCQTGRTFFPDSVLPSYHLYQPQ